MKEPISFEEICAVAQSAPRDMELPIYIGKKNNAPVYRDLARAKSLVMHGVMATGFCALSIYSMLLARKEELKQNYSLKCVTLHLPSFLFYHHALVEKYSGAADGFREFLSCYRQAKFRGISAGNRKIIFLFEGRLRTEDIVVGTHNPKFIPSDKSILKENGIELEEVAEAFENAHRYGIYIVGFDSYSVSCENYCERNSMANYVRASLRFCFADERHDEVTGTYREEQLSEESLTSDWAEAKDIERLAEMCSES